MSQTSDNTTFIEARAKEHADDMCRSFDKKSSLAFLSALEEPVQRFVGPSNAKLTYGAIEFPLDIAEDSRRSLIRALRRNRRLVSDVGLAKTMSSTLQRMYGMHRKAAISMSLALPTDLQIAILPVSEGAAR